MAFSQLSARLQDALRRLRGKGKITEADLEAALRDLRLALLEADVNYQVVKDFLARVRERALGQEVLQSLTPAQQVIKVVYDQMTELLGGEESGFLASSQPPAAVTLVGVQGSGKTSTAAKLAYLLKQKGKKPLLVAADVYRPAAVEQLEVLGQRLGVPVFKGREGSDPVEICRQAMAEARQRGYDPVLLDTAGRLHVDAEMMEELKRIKEAVRPAEILLVADAMTGQDAVRMAATFQEQLGLTGVVLTKLDGDARGGAALSIRAVTGCPIKFGTWGEGPQALEPFYPRRMASRILGLGDVLTLIEKAQAQVEQEKAEELEERWRKAEFTLEDFLLQLESIRKMGPLEELIGLLPGAARPWVGGAEQGTRVDERSLKRLTAIIQSMTREERQNPSLIDGSRRRRIARGSGTTVQEVNLLLKQYEQTRHLLHQLGSWAKKAPRGKGFPFLPLFSGRERR